MGLSSSKKKNRRWKPKCYFARSVPIKKSILDECPHEDDLVQLVGKHIYSNWYEFAVHIGVNSNTRHAIKRQNHNECKQCMMDLCAQWLEKASGTGKKPRTWNTILEATEECEYSDVAAEARKKLLAVDPVKDSNVQRAFDLLDYFAPELCNLPLCDAAKTFSKHHLITDDVYSRIMRHGQCCYSKIQRNEVIINDIAKTVQENPEFFEIFCDVLKSEFPAAENIANQMREYYLRIKSSAAVEDDDVQVEEASIIGIPANLKRMCGKYVGCLLPSAIVISFLVLAWISFSTSLSHVHTEHIPRIPSYFTGREAEVNLVMEYVRNGVNVISLTGGPGYGKSSLAIVSIHRLLEANFRAVVNHISLRGIDSIDDFATAFLRSVSDHPTFTSMSKKEQLLSWAKKLNDKHIVILDNADELTLKASTVRDNFMLLLKEFIDSTSLVQFLVTTQYRCQYPVNFEEIHLGPINASSTVNLLQKLMFSGNNYLDLSEQEVHQLRLIANLTDGIPLAGKVVGLLLKSGALSLLDVVEGLSSHPMHTLSRESFSAEERLNHCFNLSYTYLSAVQKQCFVYASRFPGSFNHKARDAVITRLTADRHCLGQLIDRSLVEYNVAVKRYSVHSLLQHFATESVRGSFKLQEFNKLFVKHFISDLRKLIKQSHLSGNVTDLSYFIVEDNLNYMQSFKYISKIQSVLTPTDLLYFVDESFLVVESRFPGDILMNMWQITLNSSCSNDTVSLCLNCSRSMAPNFLRFSVNFANLFRFSNNSISQARAILGFADGCIEKNNNFVVRAKTHAMAMHIKPLCNAKHRSDYMTFLYAKKDIALQLGNESEAEAISSILESCTRVDYKLPRDPIDFMDDEQKCVDGVKYLRNSVHKMLAKSRTEFKFCYVVQFITLVNRCSDLATARAEVYELHQVIYGSQKRLGSYESLRYCTEGFPICHLYSFLQDNYSEVQCLLQGIKKVNDDELLTLCALYIEDNRLEIEFLFFLHFRLTNLYFAILNDYTAAKKHAKIAYGISKEMAIVKIKHEFVFKAAFRLADILYANGDLKGAVLLYQEALDHLPFVPKNFVSDFYRFHWRLNIEQNVLDILIKTKQLNLAFRHYGQWAKTRVQDVTSKFVLVVKEVCHRPIFIFRSNRESSVAIKDNSFHLLPDLPIPFLNFKLFSFSTFWYYAQWLLNILLLLFIIILIGLLGPLLCYCLCTIICPIAPDSVHPGIVLRGVILIVFSFHYFLYNVIVKGLLQIPKTFTVPHKLMENPTWTRCVFVLNFILMLLFAYCAFLFLFIVSTSIGVIYNINESNLDQIKLSMTIDDTEYSKYNIVC